MRIISGIYKGRKIKVDKKSEIRPTMGMVREAIFNIITHSSFLDLPFEEIKFLDLFCGSGAVGIEAASRGARSVTVLDLDTSSAKENILSFKLEDKIKILNLDIARISDSHEKFNVVFMDPPYNSSDIIKTTLLNLVKYSWMEDKCIVIIESRYSKGVKVDINGFNTASCRRYGASEVTILFFTELKDGGNKNRDN